MILVIPMQRVWGPMMFKLGLREDNLQYHRDFLLYYTIIGMSLFVSLLLFSKEILGLITTFSYDSAANIIPIIALAYFFHGYRIFFQAGSALKDKTWDLLFIPLMTICFSGIINYFMILKYGIKGAAIATLISYLFLDIIVYIISGRSLKIKWKWKKMVYLFLLVCIIAYIFFNFIMFIDGDLLLFKKILLLIFYFIGLIVFRIIGIRELNSIKWIIQKILRINQ
jgi:O-antigen/teichoic acid export membrane protein